MDCIFCKIIAGEIPSSKVYEDDKIYCFRDINPVAPTHVLVVPKKHYDDILDISKAEDGAEYLGAVANCISKVAEADNLGNGFRVINNCGEDAGQSVPHLHFHLMAGREFGWPAG